MNKAMIFLMGNRVCEYLCNLLKLRGITIFFSVVLLHLSAINLNGQSGENSNFPSLTQITKESKDSISNREKSLRRTITTDAEGNITGTSYGTILPTQPYVAANKECVAQAEASLERANNSTFSIPSAPYPPRLVNDYTGILSEAQVALLEERCVDFANETSNQIAIVILPTFGNYDKAELAYKIASQWGVGQQQYNNGAVILVKPKVLNESGEIYIAVGRGLEPALTDVTTKRIIELRAIPAFKENDYYNGINDALNLIFPVAAGEISDDSFAPGDETDGAAFASFLFFVIFIILMLRMASKSNDNNMGSGGSGNRRNNNFSTIYILTNILNSLGGNGFGSSGGYSGGGYSGGRSGGGFGGFGGGGFSGGGAGGSW